MVEKNIEIPLTDTPINKICDVVIVGAGPVGLATAVGLRKRGIDNILVVDQARAFRQIGQGVDLLPNGLRALKYVDPNAYEAVKKASLNFVNPQQSDEEKITKFVESEPSEALLEWVFKNFQGQKIRSISLSFDVWFKNYGEGRVSISWYDLQTTLRQQIPKNQVKPNHRCINVVDEPENGCVRLNCVFDASVEANPYAYWPDRQKNNDAQSQSSEIDSQPSSTKSFRAKLVVAADGINSTVRRILYANSHNQAFAKPEYSGFAAIYCREIPYIPSELRAHIEEKFFSSSPVVTVTNYELSNSHAFSECPRMMLVNRQSTGCLVHVPVPLHSVQGKFGSDLLNLAVQELEKAGFPNALKELVQLSPPENVLQRPYYIHRALTSCTRLH